MMERAPPVVPRMRDNQNVVLCLSRVTEAISYMPRPDRGKDLAEPSAKQPAPPPLDKGGKGGSFLHRLKKTFAPSREKGGSLPSPTPVEERASPKDNRRGVPCEENDDMAQDDGAPLPVAGDEEACSSPAALDTGTQPGENFPEVLDGMDELQQDLDTCFDLLDKGLLDEDVHPCEVPPSIPAGHVEESCGEYPPSQRDKNPSSRHSHEESSHRMRKKTPAYGGRAEGDMTSTKLSVQALVRPASSKATAWASQDKADWDIVDLGYLKQTIETLKKKMEASLTGCGGRDDMIPMRIEKLRRRLVEMHMDTSQLDAFGKTWSILMARYTKCMQNPEDAAAIRERQLQHDRLLEKQAKAKEVQAEAVGAVDAAANRLVELSKMIQEMNEREVHLEEEFARIGRELSTLRKDRDLRSIELATAQDEVICLEPALQAANEDCTMIDQELQLVGQNANGDREVEAMRDSAIKEVVVEIEESLSGFLEADWLAAILAL